MQPWFSPRPPAAVGCKKRPVGRSSPVKPAALLPKGVRSVAAASFGRAGVLVQSKEITKPRFPTSGLADTPTDVFYK